jgi:hypothetical protein
MPSSASAFQESLDLILGREAHHLLDPGAVVPAAVEQNDFALARQVRDVALEIPLALLGLARLAQRDGAALPRVELVGDRLDRAPLPRRVAALEQDAQPLARRRDPARHRHQLRLHRLKQLLVALPFQPLHPHQLLLAPR